MIACIGWGSLIWCQKALPIQGLWQMDGPKLPVEFARESRDRRITLVVCDGAPLVPVLWARLDVETLDRAKHLLAEREGIQDDYVGQSIGWCTANGASEHLGAATIKQWAEQHGAEGVVWTALKPRFAGKLRAPTSEEVIRHLAELQGTTREAAEEYVRFAPRQIVTPYRTAIEKTLGWTAKGLL